MKARPDTAIGRHTVGSALVLHARNKISHEARSLAVTVPPDADNDLVVLDLHDELPVDIWESIAYALGRPRRGIRLITCGIRPDLTVLAGQWLSDRLRRPVLAPSGNTVRGVSGSLFVQAGRGGGWIRHRPRRLPSVEAKRYPRPVWDGAAADYLVTSGHGAAEPLPGGVWIRDTRDEGLLREHWKKLAASIPCLPARLTVVLGCPGTPQLALDDVVRYWRGLADDDRERVRFVAYGPVRTAPGEHPGQAIADMLDSPVVCFPGLPSGAPENPRMHSIGRDGRPGWELFAREVRYAPAHQARRAPEILSHRAPEVLGEEVAERVYRYADDAVVEVVSCGLWLRTEVPSRYADRIHSRPVDSAHSVLIVDDANPGRVRRLRELADDLIARLDPVTRASCVLQLASALTPEVPAAFVAPAGGTFRFNLSELQEPALEANPQSASPPVRFSISAGRSAGGSLSDTDERTPEWDADVPAPVVSPPPPSPPTSAMRPADVTSSDELLWDAASRSVSPAPLPSSAARAARPTSAPRQEDREPVADTLRAARRWLRETLGAELDHIAATVPQAVLERASGRDEPEARVDLAAVRLYLSAFGDGLDEALRSGSAGTQEAFALCVSAGLDRLPAHRGAAMLTANVRPEALTVLRDRPTVTERGFLNATVEPAPDPDGSTDVSIWSMTARRTGPLEPTGARAVSDRVVFRAGTTFKLLDIRPATPGVRGRLMLRELTAEESGEGRKSFDDLAMSFLEEAAERSRTAGSQAAVGSAAMHRFLNVPGLY